MLLAACQSTNSMERYHASMVLQSFQDRRLVEPLLTLLKDPLPEVRRNAVMATAPNWDPRFTDALFGLLHDPDRLVRWQAAQWLTFHESSDQTPRYLALLRDPNPDVAARALQVLAKIDPDAVPRSELLRLLGLPRMDAVSQSLTLLGIPGGLGASPASMLSQAPGGHSQPMKLTSLEASALTTNRLALARLAGLKILQRNGDAQAVALALPMLRDTNSIVRKRAYGLLCSTTGQTFPMEEFDKWQSWCNENKFSFKPGN